MHASGAITIESWDEAPYAEEEGTTKLTRASVKHAFTGDIEGRGAYEALMAYPPDGGPASFTSLLAISGRLAGRSGSFVVQGSGTYAEGTATESWTVVPGSGTDELRGLRGSGGYVATHDEVTWHLDYELE